MREKTGLSKLREGRGIISASFYEAWRRANEAKSTGTASMIYDPIAGRTVHCLSNAEKKVFLLFRFHEEVEEIFEQFPLDVNIVSDICRSKAFPQRKGIISTDFLVRRKDMSHLAVSVKGSRAEFKKSHKNYNSLVTRQEIERLYWNHLGIPFVIVFGDEVSTILASNIHNVMKFYDRTFVRDRISLLKHLIAHHVIQVPMDKEYLPYAELADKYDLEALYESCKK